MQTSRGPRGLITATAPDDTLKISTEAVGILEENEGHHQGEAPRNDLKKFDGNKLPASVDPDVIRDPHTTRHLGRDTRLPQDRGSGPQHGTNTVNARFAVVADRASEAVEEITYEEIRCYISHLLLDSKFSGNATRCVDTYCVVLKVQNVDLCLAIDFVSRVGHVLNDVQSGWQRYVLASPEPSLQAQTKPTNVPKLGEIHVETVVTQGLRPSVPGGRSTSSTVPSHRNEGAPTIADADTEAELSPVLTHEG